MGKRKSRKVKAVGVKKRKGMETGYSIPMSILWPRNKCWMSYFQEDSDRRGFLLELLWEVLHPNPCFNRTHQYICWVDLCMWTSQQQLINNLHSFIHHDSFTKHTKIRYLHANFLFGEWNRISKIRCLLIHYRALLKVKVSKWLSKSPRPGCYLVTPSTSPRPGCYWSPRPE